MQQQVQKEKALPGGLPPFNGRTGAGGYLRYKQDDRKQGRSPFSLPKD